MAIPLEGLKDESETFETPDNSDPLSFISHRFHHHMPKTSYNGKVLKTLGPMLFAALVVPVMSFAVPGMDGTFRGQDFNGIQPFERNVDENKLQVLGLTLSKSLLHDEQAMIGSSPIVEIGTGPDDRAQICYEGANGILVLEYKFQFDPNARFLEKAILSKDKKVEELYVRCTRNAKITNALSIASGIHLNMSETEMKEIWGKPSKLVPGILIYALRRSTNEYFTDDVFIYGEFKKGKLTYVEVSRRSIH